MNGTIERAIKKGDVIPKIVTLLLIKAGYSNWAIKDLEIRNKMYNVIERKYRYIFDNTSPKISERKDSKIIWTCWLQGIDAAPNIVKKCIESQKHQMKEWRHIVIDEQNLSNYVEMPEFILKKWKKGTISNAHFSDLIRLELLIKYGGIWMDSTVYLSNKVPSYIENSELFLFTNDNSFDTRRTMENWFIRSKSESVFLKYIRDVLLIYWENESKCREYFIWNLIAFHAQKKYPDELSKMERIPHNMCYMLNGILRDEYSAEKLETIYSISSIHKLSYKFDVNKMGMDSVYATLLGEKICR